MGFTSKLQGMVDLDILNIFACLNLTSISYRFLNKGRKVLKFENLTEKKRAITPNKKFENFENLMKKGQ